MGNDDTPVTPKDVWQGHLMPSIVQVNGIRAWLDGETHPEHDTFSMGREFAKALVHEFDRLTLAAGARATEVEAIWIEHAAQHDLVIARLRELHQPGDEEAEFWFDQESGPSAHCSPDCTYDTCNGHTATIQVCQECGYDHDGESPVFRGWPCPTIRAIEGGPMTQIRSYRSVELKPGTKLRYKPTGAIAVLDRRKLDGESEFGYSGWWTTEPGAGLADAVIDDSATQWEVVE